MCVENLENVESGKEKGETRGVYVGAEYKNIKAVAPASPSAR